jgi:hypothetical protein
MNLARERMRSITICFVVSVLIAGCASTSGRTQNQNVDEEDTEDYFTDVYCFPSTDPRSAANHRTPAPPLAPKAENHTEELEFLSPASRQIAEVIQVEDLVAQIPRLEKEVSDGVPDARVRLIELRQALSDQVLVALFDAFGSAAELECEKGRADSLVSGMEEKQTDIQQRRTVIALLADATAGLLSGLFLFGGSEVLAGGADIIGNILQGSFGWAALGGQQHYDLRLARNHLKEVWEGPPSSELFPESVWRFLNSPLKQGRSESRRMLLVQEWKTRFGALESEKERPQKELFFGEGGTFTGAQLRHRAEMLDRLKASVRLMGKDLSLLFKESAGHLYGVGQRSEIGAFMLD